MLEVSGSDEQEDTMTEKLLAMVVTPQGDVEQVAFSPKQTLKFLQKQVDGYIEAVPLSDEFVVWVNEEGL